MEHHAPHALARFEGWYSKFNLQSGASLALIICSVPKAKKHPPHMVSFTYVPPAGSTNRIYQKELWVKDIHRVKTGPKNAFELRVPGVGFMRSENDATTTYHLESDEFTFNATTKSTAPWSSKTNTPEGPLVYLPLPLHWHVQALASKMEYDMKFPESERSVVLPPEDRQGIAVVHQEKNWANSFPSAHIWVQARDGDRGFNLAGGQILGMTAYLMGYRNKTDKENVEIDFRPPFALKVFGWSPFMDVEPDWSNRAFHLDVCGWRQRLKVKCVAPHGSFFGLSAPFSDGHRPNFLGQSFQATLEVEVFERRGWWWAPKWESVRTDTFEGASLEFGGEYYPMAGSEVTRN